MPDVLTWHPHIRLSFGGTLGGPALEVWSNTVKYVDAALDYEPDAAELADACESLLVPLQAWFINADAFIGYTAVLKWVKLNWVLSTGLQRPGPTIMQEATTHGAHGTRVVPWYQTYALTERTELTRGRAHAGRIYPPVVSPAGVQDSPYCSAADASAMAAAWSTFLAASKVILALGGAAPNGMEPGAFYPMVTSPGSFDRGTAPLSMPITRVVCDRVADVQHRRTHQVPRAEGNESIVV